MSTSGGKFNVLQRKCDKDFKFWRGSLSSVRKTAVSKAAIMTCAHPHIPLVKKINLSPTAMSKQIVNADSIKQDQKSFCLAVRAL